MFNVLPASFPIFQWHDDSFALPPDAALLATGASVTNQAYRIGRAVYATQFHFEADRKLVSQWNSIFSETIKTLHPEWLSRHAREASTRGMAADAAGATLARAWVAAV